MLIVVFALSAWEVRQLNDIRVQAKEDVAALDEARQNQADSTLVGCQRGNELRRAVAQLEAEFERDCPLCRVALIDVDPDAVVIDDCRKTTIQITGIDPGEVSNFID
jgi:hypothetical protein